MIIIFLYRSDTNTAHPQPQAAVSSPRLVDATSTLRRSFNKAEPSSAHRLGGESARSKGRLIVGSMKSASGGRRNIACTPGDAACPINDISRCSPVPSPTLAPSSLSFLIGTRVPDRSPQAGALQPVALLVALEDAEIDLL